MPSTPNFDSVWDLLDISLLLSPFRQMGRRLSPCETVVPFGR
jgi:hypothetical protein